MQISIRHHTDEAVRFLAEVHLRHIPFASVYAATLTARVVKEREIGVMRRVFDRPTPYTINALQAVPARLRDRNPVASVEFKEFGAGVPAKRFLNPNIWGGPRSQKSHEVRLAALLGTAFVLPSKSQQTNSYGNVAGNVFKRIMSQLKVAGDQSASSSRRSKAKRKNSAYFISKNKFVLHRKTSGKGKNRVDVITPVLVPVKMPQYKKIFPFYETAAMVVADEFPRQFKIALDRAIATSNFKTKRGGKWSDTGIGFNT